jgi:hypothetical protein
MDEFTRPREDAAVEAAHAFRSVCGDRFAKLDREHGTLEARRLLAMRIGDAGQTQESGRETRAATRKETILSIELFCSGGGLSARCRRLQFHANSFVHRYI